MPYSIRQYAPMVPTLIRKPFHRDGWVYEEKVDGWRMLAYKDGGLRCLAPMPAEHNEEIFCEGVV